MIRYNTVMEQKDAERFIVPDKMDLRDIEMDRTIIPSDDDPFDNIGLSKALDNDPDHRCILPNCENALQYIDNILEGGAPEPDPILENGMTIINSIFDGDLFKNLSESEIFMIKHSITPFTESELAFLEVQGLLSNREMNNVKNKEELEEILDDIARKPTAHGILLKVIRSAALILACGFGGAVAGGILHGAIAVLAALGIAYSSYPYVEWIITKIYNIFTHSDLTTMDDKQQTLLELRSIFQANMYTAKKNKNMKAYDKLKEFYERTNEEIEQYKKVKLSVNLTA